MTDRIAARLAWVMFAVVSVTLVGALGLAIINGSVLGSTQDTSGVGGPVLFFTFPAVGVLVASRLPRNPIGWILLGIGLVWETYFVIENYIQYAFVHHPGSLWRPDLVVALTSSLWVPAVGLMGTFLILLFPDGRLPSPRWRPLAWASGITLVAQFLVTPFIPRSLRVISSNLDVPRSANPLGIEALDPIVGAWNLSVGLIPLCILGCAASLVLRFRRSQGAERLQLKWMAAAAATVAMGYLVLMATGFLTQVIGLTLPWTAVVQEVVPSLFPLIPVAVGIAVLKHRLYDIDVIINRALVYVLLTTLLVVVYVGGVVGVGGAVREFTGDADNSLIIAATTLVIAGLFRPARTRIQSFIDRRFYRHKYDAARTVESFSARLRDEIDLDSLCEELVHTVSYTMQPTQVSIWLRRSSYGTVPSGGERLKSNQL
ncbi:MAG TPA: hypothetical protein VFF07_16900 [Actinomycetota bacterium]|nr:hypothetical protein [Actinomycetota bacterium]